MPINFIGAATAMGHREIARELALACIYQFQAIRGPGNGIGNGSCCASVKGIAPDNDGLPVYRFGQSQAHLLDNEAFQAGGFFNPAQHAERQAHHVGQQIGGYESHLFVELPPCGNAFHGCYQWCMNTIPNVYVWYLYNNTAQMVAAHAGGIQFEFAALNQAIP
ncbi:MULTISPECIES: hypothetical protein [Enterobacterales]|uniref:hypothetical protein n=1 Tax=Enterobacterales TaxID=91347 RepID=UPI002ED8C9B7